MFRSGHIMLIIGLLATVGCSGGSNDGDDEIQPGASPEYADAATLYHQAAEKLASDYFGDLQTALQAALNEGDAVSTLQICSEIAPLLADLNSGGGWRIGRVSERFRNPDNRADTLELAILARFTDSATVPFTETWTETDSGAVFRYYQPIRTRQLCLKCHGDMQTLGPGVYSRLKRLYPLDRATGYHADELRGMFVVEAAWPEGVAQAERLVGGAVKTSEQGLDQ
ncbi:MAG: DUF3365 domain-containing protein [Candidatus Zixiibacteriota bacterium]|nr:MAG: DUF3365 domain-containing protein [candidate division Zixibacteria bacterium]